MTKPILTPDARRRIDECQARADKSVAWFGPLQECPDGVSIRGGYPKGEPEVFADFIVPWKDVLDVEDALARAFLAVESSVLPQDLRSSAE